MKQTLFVIRHFRTRANEEELYNSAEDMLSPDGIAAARAAAPWFRAQQFDGVFLSPLLRAQQSADAIGVVGKTDARLADIAFGSFAGKPFGSIAAHCTERGVEHRTFVLPGGESHEQVGERVQEFLTTLPLQGKFLLVTHAATIAELARLCGRSEVVAQNGALWVIENGKIIRENWLPWQETVR